MPCYCYIVECADGTYYTGWTTDPERRVATHNKGRGAKYTKMRLPVTLLYVEEQPDRNSAMKREIAIKKMGRLGKEKLIDENSKHGNKQTRRQRTRKKILE
ncbi:MAG: GIY-YIG nuclease family protein [Chloroflexota bacterium]